MLSKKIVIVTTSFLGAFVLLGSPRVASAQLMDATYHAFVKGGGTDAEGLVRLQMFHKSLLAYLGVTDLALAEVGCDKCHQLYSGLPETELTFYLPRRTLVVFAFGLAWHSVQQSRNRHSQFSVQLDAVPPPSPACPTSPPGCAPRAACEATNFCDRPKGGLCNAC